MPYVTLNPETRKMNLPDEYRHFGVESDEKSKRIEFKFPRFVDDIDLNDFNLYINYSNANDEKGLSIAEDVIVSEDEITFAWILSRHVTEYKGNVNFIVCAKKSVGEFRVQNEWNTRIATADVDQGLEVHHLVESMSADAINKLLSDLLALEPQVEQNTQARHTHPNKTVLDLFDDVSGNLYYRGQKVSDDRVDEIIDLIPEEASANNQLTDKELVENMIENGAQKFLGVYPLGGDLPANANVGDSIIVTEELSGITRDMVWMQKEENGWSSPKSRANILNPIEYTAAYSGITAEKVSEYDSAVSDLSEIQFLIPTEASSENQLADKAFVNDSISTNAAYFRGTFNSLAELQAYSGPVTNNDYAYVIVKDETDPNIIKSYQRYKYSVDQWLYEYEIGLHDLTPEQLAALDSGVTSEKIQTYDTVVVNTAGYSKNDGKPTFYGDRIKMEPKDVQLMPFGEELTFTTRTIFGNVAIYSPVSMASLVANLQSGGSISVMNDPEGMLIIYYDGENNYYRHSEDPIWYDADREPVSIDITDTITQFSNDEETATVFSDMSPYLLMSYKSFCRIVNVSTDAMGEFVYDEDTYETITWSGSEAINLEPNRNYATKLDEVAEIVGNYLVIDLPFYTNLTGKWLENFDSAFIEFVIQKGETEVDLVFNGSIMLYNGQSIDISEPGYYKVIGTWNPQASAWCLACAKMEEPSE